jgi:3-hydroxyacyl-CoA dehydrogenase/enoyl-CoA hydratase/3-hydroxybutyryl-CoA epimerase
MEQNSAFTLTKQDNGIALVAIDVPGETMNVLKAYIWSRNRSVA